MVRYRWWPDWPYSRVDEGLTIFDVVNSGTIDFKLAGLLWILMEHRASVMVAAGPIWAGKTTILYSLLDFLPPGIQQINLRGYVEDFKFADRCTPDKTYLVSEEISNHNYEYLWGYQVTRALELLPRGYALGSTIHARNVREVAYILHGILKVPLPLIARIDVVVTLQAMNGKSYYDEPIRRVDTVSILNMGENNLVAQTLAARELTEKEFIYPSEKTLYSTLSDKFAIKKDRIFDEIARREAFLRELNDRGTSSHEDVRKAILDYYQS
ncbi:MAG TPA: type II secretion system protein E [Dehalococcoidia bacterium]|nr:type II secretion system protein E [Dehalococcoidia bacterium]